MQGEIEERQEQRKRKRRKKKKSKFGYYLYAVVILILTITNITLAILLLTHVQQIEVSGSEFSEEEEIKEWMQEDPLTVNSLYTMWKFNFGSYEKPVYLQDIKVTLGAPWKVKVDVTEKEIKACFQQGETYVYFDEDGLVMLMSVQLLEKVPVIEGIYVKSANQFEQLQVENEKLFSYIADVIKETGKNELTPDKYVWEDDSMNLYFDEVCVQLGKSNYDVKIEQLPSILVGLEGKTGVLHMEHYSEIGEKISFEMEEEQTEGTTEESQNQEEEMASDTEEPAGEVTE